MEAKHKWQKDKSAMLEESTLRDSSYKIKELKSQTLVCKFQIIVVVYTFRNCRLKTNTSINLGLRRRVKPAKYKQKEIRLKIGDIHKEIISTMRVELN